MKSLIKLFEYGSLCREVQQNNVAFLNDIDWSDEELTCRELEAGRMYKSTLLCGIANSANDAVLKLLDSTPYINKYINLIDEYKGVTPLILSTINGWNYSESGTPNSSVIKKLIEKNAKINEVDQYGRTALHYACLRRDLEAVQYLIAQGANKDIKDLNGQTPLAYVVSDYDSVSKILEKVKFGRHRNTLNLDNTLFNSGNRVSDDLIRILVDGKWDKKPTAQTEVTNKVSASSKVIGESLVVNGVFNTSGSKTDPMSQTAKTLVQLGTAHD